MIDVILFRNGSRHDSAAAEEPAAAVYAGQVLYDEAARCLQGERFSVGFYVDGKLSVLHEGRP